MGIVNPRLFITYSAYQTQSLYTGSLPVDPSGSTYNDGQLIDPHTLGDDRFGRSVVSPQISYDAHGYYSQSMLQYGYDGDGTTITGSYQSNPLGLTLPLTSRFSTAYDQFTNVKSQITNLLMTRLGEGVGLDPELGTNLYSICFEQMDDVNYEGKIREEIYRVISAANSKHWLQPAVQVTSINIKRDNDKNTTYIQVLFTAATPLGSPGTAKLGTVGSIVLAF